MSGFRFNPIPSRGNLLFTSDEGGNEQFRLGLHDLRTGRSRTLGAPPGRVEGLMWNDSGTAFTYSHTPSGTDRWDIRLGRPDGSDTLLLRRPGTWTPMDMRPDGKKLLVQKYVSASRSGILVLDMETGALTPLAAASDGDTTVTCSADHAFWVRAPDGSWSVGFTSDMDGERQRLYILGPFARTQRGEPDAYGGKPRPWSMASTFDVEWAEIGPDRNTVIYSVNEEGYSRLYAARAESAEPGTALEGIPQGVIGGVYFRPPFPGRQGREGRETTEFGFTLNGPRTPGEAYTYDVRARKARRWTKSETGGLPESSFNSPRLVHYPTFDSLRIPAWFHLPDRSRFPGPRPVLILVHGGPEQQARPTFDPFVQYAVGTLGLAVVRPNVRGSSGYGRAWLNADDGLLRMNSVKDLGALLDWIAARPELDASRVAVSGRSYGGFMSLSALIEYGDRLKAGISSVGISHFPTFLQKTSGYRRDLRRAEYGDERDPGMARFLDSISPLTRMDRIATPLLLAHGRNDPRVPYGESERIFSALKGRKVPVWFMTFGDEGHSVKEQETQLAQWRVMAGFLTQQLATPRH
jgi:protease II